MDWEELQEEKLDAAFRPNKQNTRKSLLPLFLYLILERFSSEERPLSQQELMELLSKPPYELQVERKAVSRTLHSLADSGLGVRVTRKDGAWLEE